MTGCWTRCFCLCASTLVVLNAVHAVEPQHPHAQQQRGNVRRSVMAATPTTTVDTGMAMNVSNDHRSGSNDARSGNAHNMFLRRDTRNTSIVGRRRRTLSVPADDGKHDTGSAANGNKHRGSSNAGNGGDVLHRFGGQDIHIDPSVPERMFFGLPVHRFMQAIHHVIIHQYDTHSEYRDIQRQYHELYRAIEQSPACKNITKYIANHCSALKYRMHVAVRLECRDYMATALADQTKEQLMFDSSRKMNAIQISNAARAVHAFFGRWPEFGGAATAATVYADTLYYPSLVDPLMCVDSAPNADDCESQSLKLNGIYSTGAFEALCANTNARYDCCACGGGQMELNRNMYVRPLSAGVCPG